MILCLTCYFLSAHMNATLPHGTESRNSILRNNSHLSESSAREEEEHGI